MTAISLPAHNWTPRPYQEKTWRYLWEGGRHAELIWHRRSGKDEIALHAAALQAFRRVGTYWHMLPQASQARKAIWSSVNPHSGRRRIDEAFPHEIRAQTREDEMFIRFINGSTWQVLGSDNYNAMVGSPPVGIIYSEWALANPAARAYLRPILVENRGWQMFITTPRGKNHAFTTFNSAMSEANSFAQLLTVDDTNMLTPEELDSELREYQDTYGDDMGLALFMQEYYCSFEAPVLGAYYVKELNKASSEGRICRVRHDPKYPVRVACDLGRTDDTSIWIYQVVDGGLRVLENITESGKDPAWLASQLLGVEVEINLVHNKVQIRKTKEIPGLAHRRAYDYDRVGLPHDAMAKTFAAQGKTVVEQIDACFKSGVVGLVPNLSIQEGIQASRQALNHAMIDEEGCDSGLNALRSYRRKWDDNKRAFVDRPEHDWASHPADGWRYMAIDWKQAPKRERPPKAPKIGTASESFSLDLLFDDRIKREERI